MVSFVTMLLLSTPISSIGVCEIVDNIESQQAIYAPQDEYPHANSDYYVSLNEAIMSKQKNRGFIIDTRDKPPSTIEGAIQLPLYSLKNKNHFKNRPLFIIHDAISREALENNITELYLLGFTKLKIVELPHLEGAMNQIDARKVMVNASYSNWFLVSLDAPLPQSMKGLQINMNDEKSKRQLYALASHYQEYKPLGKIIITAQDTELYEQFYTTFAPAVAKQAWYIKGGIDAQIKFSQFSDTIKYGTPSLPEDCIWQ